MGTAVIPLRSRTLVNLPWRPEALTDEERRGLISFPGADFGLHNGITLSLHRWVEHSYAR